MSSKSNKYTLLDKNGYDQSDMIEMVDWDIVKSNPKNQNHNNDANYVTLDNEQIQKKPKTNTPVAQNKPQPQQVASSNNIKQPASNAPPVNRQVQPTYPTYSMNPNPTKISMNGTNFKMQNAPQPKRAPKIPQMQVACNFCTFEQNVPGNTQVYVCCCCNNMNQCFPLYGLFICGYCQSKVCYPYGTSEMIRCTRCGTVNKVPTQPRRRYATDVPKSKVQTKKQEPKKQQKRLIDFDQEDLKIEKNNQPTRPNNSKKVKQQQIFFEDLPSLAQVQQKQLNYPNLK